jgi:uncharacterized protein YndB with AHSA1/START domain
MQEIYDAWTSSKAITSWFVKTAEYTTKDGRVRAADEPVEAGDSYVWTWHGYDGKEENRILEANGKDKVVFGFGGVCKVTVLIKPCQEGHEIELVQSEIPLNEDSKVNLHLGCSVGWTVYLMNLKSFLEYGNDLRTKDDTQS